MLPQCRPSKGKDAQRAKRYNSTHTVTDIQPCSWTICDMQALVNTSMRVHHHFFMGQQLAERTFLEQAEGQLCASTPSASEYERRLFELLAPVERSVARHIHAAFFVKSACSRLAEHSEERMKRHILQDSGTTVDENAGSRLPVERLGRTSWGDGPEARCLAKESAICPTPILRHEPYNVAESLGFWAIWYEMLQAGPALCASAQRAARFGVWRSRMTAALDAHRRDASFDSIPARYEGGCKNDEQTVQAASEVEVSVAVSIANVNEHHDRACERERDARLDGAGLVDAFANDTYLVLAMAQAALRHLPSCANTSIDLSARAEHGVEEHVQRAEAHLRHYREHDPFWAVWFLTLSSVYHKLVPMCMPVPRWWALERMKNRAQMVLMKMSDPKGATFAKQIEVAASAAPPPIDWACAAPVVINPDYLVVYDLGLAPATCAALRAGGCGRAAAGFERYKRLLEALTPFRRALADGYRDAVVAALRRGKRGQNTVPPGKWAPRTDPCPFEGGFASQIGVLAERLRDALGELKAIAAGGGLEARCVAPSRSLNLLRPKLAI